MHDDALPQRSELTQKVIERLHPILYNTEDSNAYTDGLTITEVTECLVISVYSLLRRQCSGPDSLHAKCNLAQSLIEAVSAVHQLDHAYKDQLDHGEHEEE